MSCSSAAWLPDQSHTPLAFFKATTTIKECQLATVQCCPCVPSVFSQTLSSIKLIYFSWIKNYIGRLPFLRKITFSCKITMFTASFVSSPDRTVCWRPFRSGLRGFSLSTFWGRYFSQSSIDQALACLSQFGWRELIRSYRPIGTAGLHWMTAKYPQALPESFLNQWILDTERKENKPIVESEDIEVKKTTKGIQRKY